MFTFKKLALLGVAGLTAFSMSCSDTGDDDTGGEINDLKIAKDNTYDYLVTGKVVGSADNKITNIEVSALNAVVGDPNKTSGETVNLSAGLMVACSDSDVGKSITIKVTVTATFESGTTTKDVSQTHQCTGSSDSDLKSSSVVKVGGTGAEGSFVDLDPTTPKAYKSTEFLANISKIDIIYGAGFGGDDNIYSTFNAAFDTELKSSSINFSEELLALDEFSEVYILTASEQGIVKKSGVKLSEVADIIDRLETSSDDGIISATNGTAFAVLTPDSDDFIFVVITAKDGTKEISIKSVK